jgi:tetrahydromethanopterin S-methyltransferase subunit C
MGKKEELSEQIKYLTELLKLRWLSLLAIGGGTVSLVLGELTLYRQLAAGAGMIVGEILVLTLGYLHRRIRTEIQGMREV